MILTTIRTDATITSKIDGLIGSTIFAEICEVTTTLNLTG